MLLIALNQPLNEPLTQCTRRSILAGRLLGTRCAWMARYRPLLTESKFTKFVGICIFNASVDETRRIMDEDPGVQAGIFVYETHLCRGFPGDSLAR